MNTSKVKANFYLLLASVIWGLAFVAQRMGAQAIGAFTFNGIRFALGSIAIVPLMIVLRKRKSRNEHIPIKLISHVKAGIIAGSALFVAASLQQIGLAYTTAGKAAFISGLYIVLVPVLGIFLGHKNRKLTWVGVAIAAVGLYVLSVEGSFTIHKGDLFEMAGALIWAVHILILDHYSKRVDTIWLAFFQFISCSALSIVTALVFENIVFDAVVKAAAPIFYGGVFSVGIAYTLQVVGQKHAKPAHAACILGTEGVFACAGGAVILNEFMGVREYLGCVLILGGMLTSQIYQSGEIEMPEIPVKEACSTAEKNAKKTSIK